MKGGIWMDRASIVRVITLIASIIAYFGINLPESTIEAVSYVIFGIIVLYTAYKNNYLFTRGKKQKEVLEATSLYEKNK